MKRTIGRAAVTLIAAAVCAHGTFARAAEVKVMATIAFRNILNDEMPAFDRANGNMSTASYGGNSMLEKRLQSGEIDDVLFAARPAMDDMIAAGKVMPDTVVDLAKSHVGAAVRKGAPKPDISTPEKLKAAMLAAKAITFPDPAGGSITAGHITKVAKQLGINDEVQAKRRRASGSGANGPMMLGTGEVDLAFQQDAELLLAPNVELLGPLPKEFQLVTVMSVAVIKGAHNPDAAKAMIRFMQTPEAAKDMQHWGMEPVTQKTR
jgi:molybdate transport system substrate-binding protein